MNNNTLDDALMSFDDVKFKKILKLKHTDKELNKVYRNLQHTLNYYRFMLDVHDNEIFKHKLKKLLSIEKALRTKKIYKK